MIVNQSHVEDDQIMNLELFPEASEEAEVIPIQDGDLSFYPRLFSPGESDVFFRDLKEKVDWKQEEIKLYGKVIPLPRLTAWFGDEGMTYVYSGITVESQPWTETLQEIKDRVDNVSGVKFNSVLLNLYEHERHSVSWHSDDEPELGKDPTIGSVNLGATRRFWLKHKKDKTLKRSIDLPHGSYLLMAGSLQHYWVHQVPKSSRKINPRINLTFRIIQNV